MSAIVSVQDLRKTYGDLVAVGGVSFDVKEGEIFGMVGPNGAGKTTTIECVEGLRRADSGSVTVLGMSPSSDRQALAGRIGVQLQAAALPARLRVGEAMDLFACFPAKHADGAELLNSVGMASKKATAFGNLSGGEKQRLFVALALISQPRIVFFDELTTGLDPQGRHAMWDLVRQIRDRGCTVFLTTHFMEEAERLCDRVLIIDHGKIVALDTPDSLIQGLGVEKRLVFTLPADQPTPVLNLPQVKRVERSGERMIVYGQGERFTSAVVDALENGRVSFLDLRTEQANLEDVFLALTGREIRE